MSTKFFFRASASFKKIYKILAQSFRLLDTVLNKGEETQEFTLLMPNSCKAMTIKSFTRADLAWSAKIPACSEAKLKEHQYS